MSYPFCNAPMGEAGRNPNQIALAHEFAGQFTYYLRTHRTGPSDCALFAVTNSVGVPGLYP
jgi:hypothetical protein